MVKFHVTKPTASQVAWRFLPKRYVVDFAIHQMINHALPHDPWHPQLVAKVTANPDVINTASLQITCGG